MPKQMTHEMFNEWLAEQHPELNEEGLTQLQMEADPEDYDIVIIPTKMNIKEQHE